MGNKYIYCWFTSLKDKSRKPDFYPILLENATEGNDVIVNMFFVDSMCIIDVIEKENSKHE